MRTNLQLATAGNKAWAVSAQSLCHRFVGHSLDWQGQASTNLGTCSIPNFPSNFPAVHPFSIHSTNIWWLDPHVSSFWPGLNSQLSIQFPMVDIQFPSKFPMDLEEPSNFHPFSQLFLSKTIGASDFGSARGIWGRGLWPGPGLKFQGLGVTWRSCRNGYYMLWC